MNTNLTNDTNDFNNCESIENREIREKSVCLKQKPGKPFSKAWALRCQRSTIVMNLVISKLLPSSYRQHNTSFGCQRFQKEKPSLSLKNIDGLDGFSNCENIEKHEIRKNLCI